LLGTAKPLKRKSIGQSTTSSKNKRQANRINVPNFTIEGYDYIANLVDQIEGQMRELLFTVDLHANPYHQQDQGLVLRESPSSLGSTISENVGLHSNSQVKPLPTSNNQLTLSLSQPDCESKSVISDSGQDIDNNLSTTSPIS
jgi:hypothetical protein